MENIMEMESERVEQVTDKDIETGEQIQDNVKEAENEIPGEIVGEEAIIREQNDSSFPMVIEEVTSDTVTTNLEKGTNDDDPPKIDDEKTHDEKTSQLETSPHLSPSLAVALDPEEEVIIPTEGDTVEQNIESSEVSLDILKNDGDSVMVGEDSAVVHGETTNDTEISEDKGSPRHDANTVMEQEKAAEEDDMISSGDLDEFPVNPDTKLSEENGSPHHDANTVMEHDKAAEEHEIIYSGDHEELPANPVDTKVVEESNDRMDEGETNNMDLADKESGPVDHDQETTTELEKRPEVPGSETVSELENKPSEPLIETSMNVEKEPDMPATESLTDNDIDSDVLAVELSGDVDKGLSVLPAIHTSSDQDEGMTALEDEPMEDMKLDVPDSELIADATVEGYTEKEDNSGALEVNNADNESALVILEPGFPCVASSDIKPEARVTGDLNNGVYKTSPPPGFDESMSGKYKNLPPPGYDWTVSAKHKDLPPHLLPPGLDGAMSAKHKDLPPHLLPPGLDGAMSAKRSFLLDDTSDGNESGTEEDQSAFMKELDSFFKERNMDFKPPKFYGEGLNCLKLWRAVTRLGGYDKVTGSKLWRQVGESFRPPKTCTTVSWTFRGFYEKALLEYERHKVSGGELQIPLALELEPMNIDNQASGSGRARRDSAARAMQGWHSQRVNGNGEVSDPANKDKSLVPHQKREKQIGTTPGVLKRKRPSSAEHGAKNPIQVSKPMLDVTVVDVGPPADWVKINVQRTQDCFEVYALVPGLVREEVRVQSDPAGRLVISGEPENPMNPWGATPFKKVVSLPTRIDPHHTSAVVTLTGQLFVRVPLEQID